LQEIKIDSDTLKKKRFLEDNEILQKYQVIDNYSKKKGHHGTMVLTKKAPVSHTVNIIGFSQQEKEEGRVITLEYQHFILVAVYAPNPGRSEMVMSQEDDEEQDYKDQENEKYQFRTREWDPGFINYISSLQKKEAEKKEEEGNKKGIIIIGDLNALHIPEMDCLHPSKLPTAAATADSGSLIIADLLRLGFADTFRHFHSNQRKWTIMGSNPKRLDYALVSKIMLDTVIDSVINEGQTGSDHFPIELILQKKFYGL
jgi:exodeoxyribonuclease-3